MARCYVPPVDILLPNARGMGKEVVFGPCYF